MKTCLLFVALLLPSLVSAQSFTIDRNAVSAGGGTSSGAGFTVRGTVGRIDAGPTLTGATFSLTGGFWALPIAVQTPGTPTLVISFEGPDQIRISWSPNVPGYVLEEASSLNDGSWRLAPSGAANPAVVPLSLPAQFYRLARSK